VTIIRIEEDKRSLATS